MFTIIFAMIALVYVLGKLLEIVFAAIKIVIYKILTLIFFAALIYAIFYWPVIVILLRCYLFWYCWWLVRSDRIPITLFQGHGSNVSTNQIVTCTWLHVLEYVYSAHVQHHMYSSTCFEFTFITHHISIWIYACNNIVWYEKLI